MKSNIIIAGVHKAGTTSLYTYLTQHPDVCGSSIKETHFFSVGILKNYERKFNNYSDYFLSCQEKRYRVEASPEYIYGAKELARKIQSQVSNPKIIILLRNPAEKLYSSFNHRKKKLLFDKNYTFDGFMNKYITIRNIKEINDNSHEYLQELKYGCYINYIEEFYSVFNKNNIQILFFDDLKNNPKDLIKEVCDYVGLDTSFYDSFQFNIENKSVMYKNRFFHDIALSINESIEPIIRRSYKLKIILRKLYYLLNTKDKSDNLSFNNKEKLNNLYSSYNKELHQFLILKGYKKFPHWINNEKK